MKRLFALIAVLCLVCAGCSGVRGSDTRIIYLPLDASVQQLDPQVAQDAASVAVLHTVFEGLTRLEKDGSVAPAAATWTVSDDGTVYTFSLREGYWYCEGERLGRVTAQDFVFGFSRVLTAPDNDLPARRLYIIEGAEALRNGTAQQFGAQALDENTLRITLSHPDETFLQSLADSVFFPCNQAFFEQTAGRYGMSSDQLCGNGVFSLRSWGQTQLRLTKNEGHRDAAAYVLTGVRFVHRTEDTVKLLQNGSLDVGAVSPLQLQTLQQEGFSAVQTEDAALCLLFNHNRAALAQRDCRLALLAACGQQSAAGFLPPATLLSGSEPFRKTGNAVVWPTVPSPKQHWRRGLQAADLADTPHMTLLCTPQLQDTAQRILQSWQKELSVYFSIETLETAELQRRLNSGRYDMALAEQAPASPYAGGQLAAFADAAQNPCRFADAAFAAADGAADRAALQALEQALADQCVYIPLAFVPRHFAVSDKAAGIVLRPFGGGPFQSPYDLRSIV